MLLGGELNALSSIKRQNMWSSVSMEGENGSRGNFYPGFASWIELASVSCIRFQDGANVHKSTSELAKMHNTFRIVKGKTEDVRKYTQRPFSTLSPFEPLRHVIHYKGAGLC